MVLFVAERQRASAARPGRRGAAVPQPGTQVRARAVAAHALRLHHLHLAGHVLRLAGHARAAQLRRHPRAHHREQQRGRAGDLREDAPPLPAAAPDQPRQRVQVQDGDGDQERQGGEPAQLRALREAAQYGQREGQVGIQHQRRCLALRADHAETDKAEDLSFDSGKKLIVTPNH